MGSMTAALPAVIGLNAAGTAFSAAGQLRQGREMRDAANFEAEQRQRDGTVVHLALSVSPIRDARGEVIGGTAIVRDITQQKAAAEALRSWRSVPASRLRPRSAPC